MASPNLKRRRNDNSNSNNSDGDSTEITINWPRFLVMTGADNNGRDLLKLSPFAIAKGRQGIAGDPESVKKIDAGLLIEVTRKSHSTNLLSCKIFAGIPVTVSAHRTLNSRKGVIRCADVAGCSEEEIVEELADQQVTGCRRIFIKKDGERKSTNTLILTFGTTQLPPTIKVGYLVVRVDVYIPNPLRCFNCQRYGHGASRCKRDVACAKCSGNHNEADCTAKSAKCANCSGEHPAYSPSCQVYAKEKDIQRIRCQNDISFFEARKRVEAVSVATPAGISYAAVVKPKSPSVSVGTQTDITWPNGSKDPAKKVEISPSKGKSTKSASQQTSSTVTPSRGSSGQPQTSRSEEKKKEEKDSGRKTSSHKKDDAVSPVPSTKGIQRPPQRVRGPYYTIQ
jgi:hypothetical protein